MNQRSTLADWDFRNTRSGWHSVDDSAALTPTPSGVHIRGNTPGFTLTGPRCDIPAGKVALVTIIARNNGPDPFATLALGPGFRNDDSRFFLIPNTGKWETVEIALPTATPANRLRLQPMEGKGDILLRSIRLEVMDHVPAAPWVDTRTLRGKEIVVAGQWMTTPEFGTEWMLRNPGFTRTFPGNGMVLPMLVDKDALRRLGQPGDRAFFHDLLWNTTKLEWPMVAPEVARLRAIQWHHVTANYANVTLGDHSDGARQPDFRSDTDWAVVEANTALLGRACRAAGLRGIWLDTEQYGGYRVPEGQAKPAGFREGNFPFGRDTPQVLRRRGAQWIRALQREFPAVRVIITFAWSPDTAIAGFLKGVVPFLDGILLGIREPGRLVHGYENSFYYGWGPGNPFAKQGYDGSHGRFRRMRLGQRDWRKFAADPARYDRFVEVGTAAWVEDHPFAPWSGWPMGLDASVWSNLPLAVQHTDKTVWIWSEHTNYVDAFRENARSNPFCFAVLNRTLPPTDGPFQVDFRTDPMLRGWTFDFTMDAVGAKLDPDNARPVMDDRTVAYRWSPRETALVVESAQPVGLQHETQRPVPGQRQRFVRPVRALHPSESTTIEAMVEVETFGDGNRPLSLGIFSTDAPLSSGAIALRFQSATLVSLVVAGSNGKQSAALRLANPLPTKAPLRIVIKVVGQGKTVDVALFDGRQRLGSAVLRLPASLRLPALDEVGVALDEAPSLPGEKVQRMRLRSVRFDRT